MTPAPPRPTRPHAPVYKPQRGTCEDCQKTGVRLIDSPLPGDVGPRHVCAVCAAKPLSDKT
jgi:hypothetical protein